MKFYQGFVKLLLVFVLAAIAIACCKKTYTFDKHVSLWNRYEQILDSLEKQDNDYVIYYSGCACIHFTYNYIFIIVNKNEYVEITKLDNVRNI